ncbi:hypothetical protein [Streptomyces sp. 7N604]|uniref:hypothetical protein n=1 Tax=Streptomyces sp. 7N604 TaxID=3457415 RepID=UPI003FD245FB
MVLALFNRTRPASVEPPATESWPELGDTWMPEGITVVERHWNQAMSAIVLIYSADDSCYHHVVACLGCHFSAIQDPESAYSSGLKLTDTNRIATGHATSRRALSRAIPDRPDEDTARESYAS